VFSSTGAGDSLIRQELELGRVLIIKEKVPIN
jgi:hypothetical protein